MKKRPDWDDSALKHRTLCTVRRRRWWESMTVDQRASMAVYLGIRA